jgi:O-antigen ligase/tetratricopeptide (TPR) repeat protein
MGPKRQPCRPRARPTDAPAPETAPVADRAGALGRGLLFLHLLLSPLVFSRATLEVFEYNKVALLLLTAVALVALGVAAGIARFRQLTAGAKRDWCEPIGLGLLLFLVSAVLSTALSISPRTSFYGADESFAGLQTVAAYTVLYFATRICFRTADEGRRLLAATVIASAVVSLYAVVQVAQLDPIRWTDVSGYGPYVRPFATLGHPNLLGAYLVMALPITAFFALRVLRQRRWWSSAALMALGALAVGVIVLTLSRGAWLALGAVAGTALVLRGRAAGSGDPRRAPGDARPARKRLALAAAVLTLTVLGGCLLAGPGFRHGLAQRARYLTDAANRQYLWRASVVIFREHPLVGCGLDTFELAFVGKRPPAYWQLEWNSPTPKAHCEPLQVLATQGLVGGLALAALAFGLVRAGWRAMRLDRDRYFVVALVAGIVGFCVQDLFSFTVAGTGTLFVTLAALLSRQAEDGAATASDERRALRPPCGSAGINPAARRVSAQAAVWLGGLALAYVGVVRPYQANRECAQADALAEVDPPAAVAHAERAVALDPGKDTYWAKLGWAAESAARAASEPQEQRRLFDQARKAFERAVALVPVSSGNHALLGGFLGELAHRGLVPPRQALAELDAALTLDPSNAYFYRDACRVALAVGDVARAHRYAVRGTELYPQFASLRALLGCVALLEGRPEEAVRLHNAAFRCNWYGDDSALHLAEATMAASLVKARRGPAAVAFARLAVERNPQSIDAHLCLADALALVGRREEAIAEYVTVLEEHPEHAAARSALERLGGKLP